MCLDYFLSVSIEQHWWLIHHFDKELILISYLYWGQQAEDRQKDQVLLHVRCVLHHGVEDYLLIKPLFSWEHSEFLGKGSLQFVWAKKYVAWNERFFLTYKLFSVKGIVHHRNHQNRFNATVLRNKTEHWVKLIKDNLSCRNQVSLIGHFLSVSYQIKWVFHNVYHLHGYVEIKFIIWKYLEVSVDQIRVPLTWSDNVKDLRDTIFLVLLEI